MPMGAQFLGNQTGGCGYTGLARLISGGVLRLMRLEFLSLVFRDHLELCGGHDRDHAGEKWPRSPSPQIPAAEGYSTCHANRIRSVAWWRSPVCCRVNSRLRWALPVRAEMCLRSAWLGALSDVEKNYTAHAQPPWSDPSRGQVARTGQSYCRIALLIS